MDILELQSLIVQGSVKMGESLPTLRELTASYKCSPNTAQKALKELEEAGFVYNKGRKGYIVTAKQHMQNKDGCIGYVSSLDQEMIYGQRENLIIALQKEAHLRGKSLLLLSKDEFKTRDICSYLLKRNIQGLIFEEIEEESLGDLFEVGLPMIYSGVFNSVNENPIDVIQQDDYQGGRLAAQYFIDKGHQEFAWFGPKFISDSSRQRFMGVLSVWLENGLNLGTEWSSDLFDEENLREQAYKLLTAPNRPKAILCLWHSPCILLHQVAKEFGLKSPVDVEIVGWAEEAELKNFERYAPGFLEHNAVIVWSSKIMSQVMISRLSLFQPACTHVPLKILIPMSRLGGKH